MKGQELETQYVEAKGELLFELKAKTTTVTVKEFTPAGVRTETNLQGEMRGKFNAIHLETVIALAKPDGTVEYEVHGISTTQDGDTVLNTSKGRGRLENPTMGRYEGEDTFQTFSNKLAWLNSTKAQHEATYNFVTGELLVKSHAKK